nr:MAG TPA: hypothetical protein [Caudoviricetes sp.]
MKFLLGALAILILLCSFLGYKTYDLSEEKATLGVALKEAGKALEDQKKAYETKDLSCKQDDTSIVELEQEKSSISNKSDDITEALNKLSKTTPKNNNGASNAPQKENQNVIQKDVYLPDDGLLSGNLRRLLTESYCIAEPTSDQCLSTKQSSDTSM